MFNLEEGDILWLKNIYGKSIIDIREVNKKIKIEFYLRDIKSKFVSVLVDYNHFSIRFWDESTYHFEEIRIYHPSPDKNEIYFYCKNQEDISRLRAFKEKKHNVLSCEAKLKKYLLKFVF